MLYFFVSIIVIKLFEMIIKLFEMIIKLFEMIIKLCEMIIKLYEKPCKNSPGIPYLINLILLHNSSALFILLSSG